MNKQNKIMDHTPNMSTTPVMAAIVSSGVEAAGFVTPSFRNPNKFPSTPNNLKPNALKVKASRRSFTPMRNIVKSPELSPIEFTLKNTPQFRVASEQSGDCSIDFSVTMPSPPDYSVKTPVINKSYLDHKINLDLILMSHQLHKYLALFDREDIDFNTFISLNENDLIKLGVENRQDRLKMLKAIKEFQ